VVVKVVGDDDEGGGDDDDFTFTFFKINKK
jgi:hypothetical protein